MLSILTLPIPVGTGAKAIGTAWTIAPSEEEESIWGGKTLTKGNYTLFTPTSSTLSNASRAVGGGV